ncbi:MAG: hypothetical protein IH598_16785, partial [Bacteroidales bacterium]|nr:hypothetical protein [Bacteroidales bacterium]
MKKLLLFSVLCFLLAIVSRAEYLTCFYTPGDVTIFAPYNGTIISIREIKPPNSSVWERTTRWADQVLSCKVNEGYYLLSTTEKVSLLVGDHINGPSTITRGYYALDQDGKGTGVKMFTNLRANSDAGEPVLIVFSYRNSNRVKIEEPGEFSAYSLMWEGTINEGGNYIYKSSYNQNLRITSDYPVSVLVTGKSMQCSPADYSIPSSSGSFYGEEFNTFLPGGLLSLRAYNDETKIDLLNPQNSVLKSWNLNSGDFIEQDIMQLSVGGNKFFKILSNHPINASRITKSQQAQGMDCLTDRSGSLYGNEYNIHAAAPVEIFSFEDNTQVYIGLQGNKKLVILSGKEHYSLTSNSGIISGEVVSDKAVLLLTANKSGASFIKIPETQITSIPGPPSIFNVRHDPYHPTTNDGSVEISWVTSEVCSTVLHYRVQGQTWQELPDNTFRSGHFRKIPVSSFKANDIVEYYVTALDNDSYVVENNNGTYFKFEISPFIPVLTLFREPTTLPNPGCDSYKVNLLVTNTGSVKATNIKIKEQLYGLLASSDNCKVIPKSNYQYDVEISVPDIEPNQSNTVSYQVFPLLYSNNYSFNIGTGMTTITYESPNGNKYSPPLSPPITVEHLDYNDVYKEIRKKDYLIVTNTLGLMAYLNPENAGRVLREAAAFALARNGVIACVEVSDPIKIEKLIDNDWNNRLSPMGWLGGWEYLLFLGGVEIVPTFECNYDWTFGGTRAKVADNIYADVKVDDNNFPELMIGRLPGKCANSLIYQLQKSLYTVSSEKGFLLSGTGDGQDDFVWVINNLSKSIKPYSNIKVIHWKDITSNYGYKS